MGHNREHHASKTARLRVLVIPEHDAGARWTLGVSLPVLAGTICGLFAATVAVTVVLIGYTPIGRIVPMSTAEMERRYGSELVELQSRLNKLSEDVIVLREYNLKLRRALGEDVQRDTMPDLAARSQVRQSSEERPAELWLQQQNPSGGMQQSPVLLRAMQAARQGTLRASFPISSPVIGYVSRPFDGERGHYGMDYSARQGTVVAAVADGYVVFAGWTYEDGYMIILSHGSGYFSIYKHNQSLLCAPNDFVRRGHEIALVGNSGRTSYGPHLHFELWKDGQPQNPEDFILSSKSASIN